MKRETRIATLLTIGGALLATTAIQAQPPQSYSGPPQGSMPPQGQTQATDAGAVTNAATTTTTTTTVPTDVIATEETYTENTAPLANTGGEPWLLAMGGMAIAGSALMMRRRYNN